MVVFPRFGISCIRRSYILNFHAMKARSTHAGLPVHSITQGTLDIHEPIIAQLQTVPNTEVTIALSLYM